MDSENTKQWLGVDIKFISIYAVVIFLMDLIAYIPSLLIESLIHRDTVDLTRGFEQYYTQVYPVKTIIMIIVSCIIFYVLSVKIEEKRAFMFRAEVKKSSLIIEQLIASSLIFAIWLWVFIKSFTISIIVMPLANFCAYIFGFVDIHAPLNEAFVEVDAFGSYAKAFSVWLIPLCMLIMFVFWNVIMYIARKKGTVSGLKKKEEEKASLYAELEKKRK